MLWPFGQRVGFQILVKGLVKDAYLAGILVASGITGTYHVLGYDRFVVVVALAVTAFSTYDGNGDFSQGVRGG